MNIRLPLKGTLSLLGLLCLAQTPTADAQSYMERMGGGASASAPAPAPAAAKAPVAKTAPTSKAANKPNAAVAARPAPTGRGEIDALRAELATLREELARVQNLSSVERMEGDSAAQAEVSHDPMEEEHDVDPEGEGHALSSEGHEEALAMVTPKGATAFPATTSTATAPSDLSSESVGVTLDLTTESAYVFRGYNTFQANGQGDQFAYLAPSITWSVGDTGLSLGYWGAYQLVGDNRVDRVAAGSGAEQDLILGYGFDMGENLAGSVGAVYYFYPFADADTAGVATPSYLEPSFSLSTNGDVSFGFFTSLMYGVQEALAGGRYVYFNPSVSRSIELAGWESISMGIGGGYKAYTQAPSALAAGALDLRVDWSFTRAFSDRYYVTPSAHAAWTNVPNAGLEDEYVVWFSLSAGSNL